MRERWAGVRILSVNEEPRGATPGSPLRMTRAACDLGGLSAADLRVEFKARRLLPDAKFDLAPLNSFGHGIPEGQWRAEFSSTGEKAADGGTLYSVSAVPPATGQYQLEVRVYPVARAAESPARSGADEDALGASVAVSSRPAAAGPAPPSRAVRAVAAAVATTSMAAEVRAAVVA